MGSDAPVSDPDLGREAFSAFVAALPKDDCGLRGWDSLPAEERAAWGAVGPAVASRPQNALGVGAPAVALFEQDFASLLQAFVDLAGDVLLQRAINVLRSRISIDTMVRREMMSDPRLLAFFVKIRKALNTGDVVLPGPGVRPVPVAADILPKEKTSPYERKVLSSLGRFTLEFEEVTGGTGYHMVLLDRGDQVGTEDAPGVMCVPTSDEALLENAELSAEDAEHVRSSVPSIVGWLGPLGWRITGDDDEPPVSS